MIVLARRINNGKVSLEGADALRAIIRREPVAATSAFRWLVDGDQAIAFYDLDADLKRAEDKPPGPPETWIPAYIGERLGLSPVRRLALVYMEPQTDEETVLDPQLVDASGFSMSFEATIVDVDLKPEVLIPPLLQKVKEVSDMDLPPAGRPGCKDCEALGSLIDTLGRRT